MTAACGTPGGSVPFAKRLAVELTGVAEVQIGQAAGGWTVDVTPRRNGARAVGWIDFGNEIVVQVGDPGGRWELGGGEDDLAFLEALVESVVAGRVLEVAAPGRSRVVVTLPDGSRNAETGYVAPTGCLPLPLWRLWSRKMQYLPYRQPRPPSAAVPG